VDVDEKRVAGLLKESCVFVVYATIFLSSVKNGKRAWCTIATKKLRINLSLLVRTKKNS
jgi:hypothetical protein